MNQTTQRPRRFPISQSDYTLPTQCTWKPYVPQVCAVQPVRTHRTKSVCFQGDAVPLQGMPISSSCYAVIDSNIQQTGIDSNQLGEQYVAARKSRTQQRFHVIKYATNKLRFNYFYCLVGLLLIGYISISMIYHWWTLFSELSRQEQYRAKQTSGNRHFDPGELVASTDSTNQKSNSPIRPRAMEEWPLIGVILFSLLFASSVGFGICCFVSTGNYANDGVLIKASKGNCRRHQGKKFKNRCSQNQSNSFSTNGDPNEQLTAQERKEVGQFSWVDRVCFRCLDIHLGCKMKWPFLNSNAKSPMKRILKSPSTISALSLIPPWNAVLHLWAAFCLYALKKMLHAVRIRYDLCPDSMTN